MADGEEPDRRRTLAVFRHRSFSLFWWARLLATFSAQVVSVAVGWQVYDLTRNPLDLGLVGLSQFAPALALVLVTGAVADRFNRKLVCLVCLGLEITGALALLALSLTGNRSIVPILIVLVGFGIARAFFSPASQALLPNLVPPKDLATAVSFNTMAWQIATIVGPVVGGLLYGLGSGVAYGAATGMLALAGILIWPMVAPAQAPTAGRTDWTDVVAGFRFVWQARILFGAISLDLFAVLLSGAVALMPAYARDILQTGPFGLGLLRAAPGLGAIAMALVLARWPITNHAGALMFAAVAAFGGLTVLFGVSTTVWISVIALLGMGAADMVSVYVREVLVQMATPDAVRGRVNAVNMVFVGASNELGEFRAGTMAHFVGIVPAVVIGGIGAILVAGLWAVWFPELRRAKRLDGL